MPEITENLKRLLREVKLIEKLPPKEENFFSISGRGHWENPTSDLLRYFMQPRGQHEFKTAFLRAFFECIRVDCSMLSFDDVKVGREAKTRAGKRIDLLITGQDWVLAIENKMRAPLYNDLADYKEHVRRLGKKHEFFAVLSPRPVSEEGWTSVTYERYCVALKSLLPEDDRKRRLSKWEVFATEFIDHLINELYKPTKPMKPEQRAFVEENLQNIEEIKKLSLCYTTELLHELTQRLKVEVPGNYAFAFSRAPWGAFECNVRIGQLDILLYFLPPFYHCEKPEPRFKVGADVSRLTPESVERVKTLLAEKHSVFEGRDCWEAFFDGSTDAENGLCRLAKQLFNLLEQEIQPSV